MPYQRPAGASTTTPCHPLPYLALAGNLARRDKPVRLDNPVRLDGRGGPASMAQQVQQVQLAQPVLMALMALLAPRVKKAVAVWTATQARPENKGVTVVLGHQVVTATQVRQVATATQVRRDKPDQPDRQAQLASPPLRWLLSSHRCWRTVQHLIKKTCMTSMGTADRSKRS